ncbi:MAG: transketolase family protein [Bauldia sp.]|nr:transketolase family protein [Bauldia sp.]
MAERTYAKAMGIDEEAAERATVDAPFGAALVEVARSRGDIVGLTADLGKYTDIHPFRDAFPDRFFNVGMAEQNLVAVAAGLARTGHVPFATTYGVFATRRAYDYIAIACAHSNVNVKIIAGLPGLTTGYGGTHQAIEDLALMRMVPNLVVIDPCDATDITQITHAIAASDGPVYMRLLRGKVNRVLDPDAYRFEIGKAFVLKQGTDVGIVATGFMTERALDAAAALTAEGVDAGVLHVPTVKPFDTETVTQFAASVRAVVTAENHVTRGGLGTQVAEALYDAGISRPLHRVGIPDAFIELAAVPTLAERVGLTPEAIVASALAALKEA